MKVLWLGCGDIGLRATALLDGCHTVAAMRRRVEKLPTGMTSFTGNICDTERLRAVLSEYRPDVLVVTLTPSTMSDEGYRSSYVAGANSLQQAMTDLGLEAMVLWVSSSAVYGQGNGVWVDETSPTEPQHYRGRRLLEAEQIVLGSSLQACVVRFSGIYGPGRGRLLNRIRSGQLAGPEAGQWTNRIHSDDCAGVLAYLINKIQAGETLMPIYLASDSEPVVAHQMQRELAQIMGVAVLPSTEVQAGTAGRRCSNRALLQGGYQFRYPSWREGYRAVLAAEGVESGAA